MIYFRDIIMSGDIITLNVGGRLFTTSRMTLQVFGGG